MALNISVSDDGFMAGPNQSEDSPMGENGKLLHSWAFATESMQERFGGSGGTVGIDNDLIIRGFANIGATIMGRNMFGPIRGEWPDDNWKGWWGPNPVFTHPVYVLTHFPRETIDMGNGTIFTFITDGVERAYELARIAAKDRDVRVGGGAKTIQQFMELGMLDELHVAQTNVTMNSGEPLFSNQELQLKRYREASSIVSGTVIHKTYLRN